MVIRVASFAVLAVLLCVGISMAAAIELPRTGQTTCYNETGIEIACAGTGQDGATQAGAALPVPRFTADYYGLTVRDNLTGLMWTVDSRTPDPYDPTDPVCAQDGRLITWQGALSYIACLNAYVDPGCESQPGFLCHNDWRLPNRWELRSLIVDNSASGPALASGQPFINVEDGWHYWSSTNCTTYLVSDTYGGHDGAGAWVENIWDGTEYCQDPTEACREGGGDNCYTPIFAWPVRAGQTDGNPDPAYPANIPKTGQTDSVVQGDDGALETGVTWPAPRFTVAYCDENGPCPNPAVDCDEDPLNDVVTDNLTGLTWVRLPDNIHRTWGEALDYANDLSLCGYANWRLPNINELASMRIPVHVEH